MINLLRKEDCCGCGACFDACAYKAIEWKDDDEGFSYPVFNSALCRDCGLCNKVCPFINSDSINKENGDFSPIVLGAYHKDEVIRFTSTSGGAFWGLAEAFIKSGGFVAGAIWTEDFHVVHYVTNELKELERIKGSKYVQSDCRGLYKKIRSLLRKGKKIMATGVPCQMAALRQFLHKDYDNLIVVDLICHSVPSPLAFQKYKGYLERSYKSQMLIYHPKNKEYGGWHNFAFKANFANGKVYSLNGCDDLFTRIFVGSGNILSRPSCYECHFKHFPQPSDITIGDFWGIEFIDPTFDSPNGVSKIILNNQKGKTYYESLSCFVNKYYDTETSVYKNWRSSSMIKTIPRPNMQKRKQFVSDLKTMEFQACMNKHFPKNKGINSLIKKYIKHFFKK